jgi:hypothetical protein
MSKNKDKNSLNTSCYRGIHGNLPDAEEPCIGSFAKVYIKGSDKTKSDSIAFGTVIRISCSNEGDKVYKLSGSNGGIYKGSEYDVILYSLENPEVRKIYEFEVKN